MTLDLFVRYLHYVSIILVAGALVSQHMLLATTLSRQAIKKISRIDMMYGVMMITVLMTGLALWLWVGKDASFYSKNPLLHIKLTLFVILGIISIVPTIFFIKQSKGPSDEMVAIPKKIYWYIRIELLLLLIIPYCAILIAEGISF